MKLDFNASSTVELRTLHILFQETWILIWHSVLVPQVEIPPLTTDSMTCRL
jgi:hypothetical protein